MKTTPSLRSLFLCLSLLVLPPLLSEVLSDQGMTRSDTENSNSTRSAILLLAPGGYSADAFGDYPSDVVMHSVAGEKWHEVPWTPAGVIRVEAPPKSAGTEKARAEAIHYFKQVIAPHALPPDFTGRLVLRRMVFPDRTNDVIDLRYRFRNLAIWARQDASGLTVWAQEIGSEKPSATAVPEQVHARALSQPEWMGWWKPEHQEMLDRILATASTLFVRRDDLPKEIRVRGNPWPAYRYPGIHVELYGTEGLGYGRFAKVPDVFKGETWPGGVEPPRFLRYEEAGKRLFLEFLAWTDGQTVTFSFLKSTGTPLLGSAAPAAKWFSGIPESIIVRAPRIWSHPGRTNTLEPFWVTWGDPYGSTLRASPPSAVPQSARRTTEPLRGPAGFPSDVVDAVGG